MKFSKTGIILASIFLSVTIIPGIYLQLSYGDNQWMWSFIFGGMPMSSYGFSILWFATTSASIFLGWTLLLGSYLLNISIFYFIGFGIEKLYKKFHT